MPGMRRIAVLAGALTLSAAAVVAATSTDAGAAEPVAATTVEVHGTLLVAQTDEPGSRPTYAVALADGDIVPVSGPLGDARPLSHFTGRLVLPASVVSALAAHGTSVARNATLGATSASGSDALQLVDQRSLTLRVSGTPTLTARAPTVTSTSHQQFVTAMDNKGALGQRDSKLLGHVSTVASYWKGEANGAITSIRVPDRVTHYKTTLSTTDCGLGSDFFDVVQEAAARFPDVDMFGGSNQLVVFVSPACSSGSLVGEGTVGTSFASGGALIVKAGTAINGAYAHETGHNYGFAHANARVSGSSLEYFGAYDVMGYVLPGYNGLTALSTPYRVFQGITDDGEVRDVPIGLGTTAVHVSATIRPRDHDAGLRSVRVVNPDTGRALYLDYRSGRGQDVGAFYTAHGMYLKLDPGAAPLRAGGHHQRRPRRFGCRHPGPGRQRRHLARRRLHVDQRLGRPERPRRCPRRGRRARHRPVRSSESQGVEAGECGQGRGRQDAHRQARRLDERHDVRLLLVRRTGRRSSTLRGLADADPCPAGPADHGEGDRDEARVRDGVEDVGQDLEGALTQPPAPCVAGS